MLMRFKLIGLLLFGVCFKQKTAFDMRISDLSSDVCSSDLLSVPNPHSQLQAKPACTRKLRRSLSDLVNPRPPRNEPNEPVGSRAPKVLCVDDNPDRKSVVSGKRV